MTCPLIQLDFKDREVQTEDSQNSPTAITGVKVDAEMQTESEEAERIDIEQKTGGFQVSDDRKEIVLPRSESCPTLDVILSDVKDPDFLPPQEDILKLDLEQIKYFIMSKETDIVDDFVIL